MMALQRNIHYSKLLRGPLFRKSTLSTAPGCAEVRYTFASQEKDKASAEVFSEQCVRDVQDRLEGFGCKVEKIKCFAEELEPDPVREPVKDHENQEKKKKGHCHDR